MIIIQGQGGIPLIKANIVDLRNDSNQVVAMANSGHRHILGKYATRERCLEIIDEIQTFAGRIFRDQLTPTGTACDICPIYQMPEE